MLVFLDETFREVTTPNDEKIPFGALCSVGIPINIYSRVANAVFKLKLDTMGKEYAEENELKELYSWKDNYGRVMSSLRWLDPHKVSPKRQKK